MRHRAGARAPLRLPLILARRAPRQLPLVAEQVLEVVVAPLRRSGGPGDLEAAGERVGAMALAEAVLPAEALVDDVSTFRVGPDVGLRARTVGLSEGVAAGDQRHRLLVVHRHAG